MNADDENDDLEAPAVLPPGEDVEEVDREFQRRQRMMTAEVRPAP